MADDVEELKQQVAELQSQLAFHEDSVSSLDHALAAQQQEILLLRRQLELMQQRHAEFAARHEAGEGRSPVDDEKPPHY